jgi:NADH-dependent peroxiredoxin subunit F
MTHIYDLIIVGGGPAGISAGIYAARKKINTLLVAKNFGGQMSQKSVEIENYPGFSEISGQELIQKLVNHLKKFEIGIVAQNAVKIEKAGEIFLVTADDGQNFQAKAVIVASGSEPRHLDVPGEREFLGKGVSYCSICDGPFFTDKTVAVLGGGNAAFETAASLSKLAKNIYILENSPEIRADAVIQERAMASGKCQIITNASVLEITGDKFVSGLVFEDQQTKEKKELKLDGIFVEIGSVPVTSFLDDTLVDFNEKKEIVVDLATNQTKTPGLFAAGDVGSFPYKQIIIAAGEGAKAALSANNYLKSKK